MASLASLALLPPAPAQAQTTIDLVKNTGQTTGASTTAATGGQAFTTGASSGGYTLTEVKILYEDVPENASKTSGVEIRNNSASDKPGTLVATLTQSGTAALRGEITFTAPSNTTLNASTTYWLIVNEELTDTATYSTTTSSTETGSTGWSTGTTWVNTGTESTVIKAAIRGYANTSLTASAITYNSATLTLSGNSATWYLKRTAPTAGTCSMMRASTVTTESLTGLSADTSYTYKAYSDSTCATAIASETFKTDPAATPPSVTTQLFVLFYTNQDAIRIPPATKSQTFTFASGTELIGSIPNSTTRIGMCATGTTREVGWYKSDALTTKLGTSSTNFLGSLGLNYTPTAVGEYRALAYCKRGTVYSAAANLMGTGGKVTLTPAPALSASPVGKTSATLTLANNDAAWYYKRTAPTATTCSSEQTAATTMVSLTSLSANTEYTYKAYSDSGCATAIASVTFTTKPADPPTFGGSAVLTSVSYGETRNRAAGSGAWNESFNFKSGTAFTALITPGTITCDTGTTAEIGWYKSTALTTRVGSYSQVGSTTVYQLSATPTTAGEYRALGYCTQGTGASKVYSTAKNLMRGGAVTLSGATIGLAQSNVKQTSATLTLSNNLGTWYYKSTASGASCSGAQAVATTAVNLTGLSANTSYTYKAYRDSTCDTEIASVTFTTQAAPTLTGTTKIWSGTLTVDAVRGNYGCDSEDGTFDSCSSSSVLSDNDFTYGSKTYTIKTMIINTTGHLLIAFDGDPNLAPGIKDSGTLNAGNYLSFSSAIVSPLKHIVWRNVGTGLGWTDGQSVSLEINAPLPGVTFSPTMVSVNEGSSAEYTARLKTKPLANVTVTVTKKTGGDGDLTFSGSPLTFTNSDWDTAQTLTVSAAEDTDSSAGSATLEHGAGSGDDVYDGLTISDVVATEVDNDAAGVAVSGSPLAVNEGSSNTYTLVLNSQPSSNVTVTATRKTGGDTDLSLSGSPLTFTNSDWDTAQTLTVSAAEDDGDSSAGSATFQHSASSGDSNYNGASITIAELVANEVENDTPGVTVTGSPLAVNESSSNTYTLVLTAQPSSNVTVTATRKTGGDTDLTVSGSPLTFTNGNWDTAQTLTVSGAEDGDTTNGSATFQHSASSGDSRYDGASVTIGELVANEVDKNTAGVTVTGSPLAVNEGSSNTYTLVLGAQPTSNVTVTVAGKAGGDDDLLLSGSPLTFTDANWNTAQTLTVSAAEDADTTNGSATYEHSASSGDNRYDGASITISELVDNEVDNDMPGVTVSDSPLAVNEGNSNTYTLVLTTQPSSNVTVTATRKTGGDTDLSLSGSPLTFTNGNWNTAQTLTVSAAEDADTSAGSATFQHSASSGDTNYDGNNVTISELVANEVDNDMPGVTVSGSPLAVNEGSSNTYTLVLTAQPSSNVTVTAARKTGGDTDLSLSGSPLTFTNTNWNTAQTLTVSAAEDADTSAGSATFEHSASSGDTNYDGASITISELVANEVDNDVSGVAVTGSPLSINEGSSNTYTLVLNTQPSSNVTVTAARKTGGDTDLSLSGSPLTFTNANWNTAQTLTVSAAEDADTSAGTATFQHSASSGDSNYDGANVTISELVANEVDNDAPSANLASSAVTQTSATLTLTGNSAAWSYKQTAPTEGSCSPQTGGTTMVSLTSLSPNTTYTYKAYSDSTCTTEMASARFTTTATSAPAGDGGGGGSSTPPSPPVSVADVEGSGDPGSQTVRITFRQPVRKGQGNITLTPEAENGTASQTRLLAPSTASTTSCPTSPSTITIPVTSDQVTISGATVTIQPATTALPPGNVCMEIAANALLTPSGEGNPTIVRRFRIEDHTAPNLDSTNPGNGATDVAVDAHLVLTFSEPVKKPRKTGLGNIVLQADGGGSVTIPVASNQVTISGSTVTVNPTNHLDGGATYHVLIPPGAIQDLAGNDHVGITDANAWRFTTEDNTPLLLTRTNPGNGATDVAVDAHLVLTFNQPVRTGRGSVTITPATGAAVAIPVTDNNQVTVRGRTVTINPTSDLDGGVSYHVLIPPGAIQDLTGNDYVGITDAHAWRFTTTAGFQSAVKAWNARFGRTVADQVLDAVQTRLRSTHVPGLEVHLAGQQLEWPDASDVTQPVAQQVVDQLAQWLVVGSGDSGAAALRTVNGHDLLASSSFAFTSPVPDGGLLSFWGRGAVTSFDGREGEVTLDGQVTTWMLGTDWSWGQWPDGGEARRSTAGLLLSRSTGDGGLTGADTGDVDALRGVPLDRPPLHGSAGGLGCCGLWTG